MFEGHVIESRCLNGIWLIIRVGIFKEIASLYRDRDRDRDRDRNIQLLSGWWAGFNPQALCHGHVIFIIICSFIVWLQISSRTSSAVTRSKISEGIRGTLVKSRF